MRINVTAILMTIFLLKVSASDSFAQKITLNRKNASLKEVFAEIKKQTGYSVLYKSAVIRNAKPVTVELSNVQLEEAMPKILHGQNLDFAIDDRAIVIKEKEKSIPERLKDFFSEEETNVKPQQSETRGRVTDSIGNPLQGASIRAKNHQLSTITNRNGEFLLRNVPEDAVLEISYIGYTTQEVKASADLGTLVLQESSSDLEEVEVSVSTGYQDLPKERVTGSFVVLDSAVLNRSNSTDILDRLDGVTSGLVFNRNKAQIGHSDIIIRGRSTIFGDDAPLIVVDNFPYEGDISAINPNDVLQISILRDAAAASIWGTRAGNGVIVITTKKGAFDSKPQISFSANATIGQKPDLFETPWFSAEEWIEIEQFLYERGAYRTTINNGFGHISPAVEIMDWTVNGIITREDSLQRINALKGYDVRNDISEYYYRPNVNQQYALNMSGGGTFNKYFVSAGYDKNLRQTKTDSYDRFTLNANNTYNFFEDKLEINTGILFSSSSDKGMSGPGNYAPTSPYLRLADDNGNHLAVTDGVLRTSYVETAGDGHLLDWNFRPLDELATNRENRRTSYRLNGNVIYKVIDALSLSLMYQYQRDNSKGETIQNRDSYYVRNQINRLSVLNYNTGEVLRPIPLGAIMDLSNSEYSSNYGRMQATYNKSFNKAHEVSAIGGVEIRDDQVVSNGHRLFGYNEETGTNANSIMNFNDLNPLFYNQGSTTRISPGISTNFTVDRYFSYYANASYTYKSRYTLTGSARKDESNLFGVKPNQRGVPLWSTGLLWNVGKEDFYNVDWMPSLKLRASYGYSGNVSKSISSYLTANAVSNRNSWGLPYNEIVNPPNPSLSWERVKVINIGIDFNTKNNRISGSIEPYWKYGLDLIGGSPLAPQTGMPTYTSNSANTYTRGIDIILHTNNLNGAFKWSTDFLFSTNRDEVTAYFANEATNLSVVTLSYNNPVVGNPYHSLYGYKWAGLNEVGAPTVYFNDESSTEYIAVRNSLDRNNISYVGSYVPVTTGSFRNTVNFKQLELSFNITYRLGYYFRRMSLNNGTIYSTNGFMYRWDYDQRWQQPGDELITNVPSIIYPSNVSRNDIYANSDVLIEKGDNIRLQDIRFSWNIRNAIPNLTNLHVFAYLNNIGYLWRANNYGLDPDNPRPSTTSFSAPRTVAFGLKTDF